MPSELTNPGDAEEKRYSGHRVDRVTLDSAHHSLAPKCNSSAPGHPQGYALVRCSAAASAAPKWVLEPHTTLQPVHSEAFNNTHSVIENLFSVDSARITSSSIKHSHIFFLFLDSCPVQNILNFKQCFYNSVKMTSKWMEKRTENHPAAGLDAEAVTQIQTSDHPQIINLMPKCQIW